MRSCNSYQDIKTPDEIEEENRYEMFEKEAEDYALSNIGRNDLLFKSFKDGAEFGYKKGQSDQLVHKQYQLNQLRKANEWHYVKDGDLPRNDTKVLVLLENKRLKISTFMKNVFTLWNKDYDAYTKLYGVIAWKEIVLPELEESK